VPAARHQQAHPGHKVYPYLLRKLAIEPRQPGLGAGHTYIPMARGFVYLTAVVDVASRRVLAHKVAITLEACHAERSSSRRLPAGAPEIVNTDQGSQFTADRVHRRRCSPQAAAVSMDGRGAWRDNVFVERLWRSVKYERVYLKAYDGVSAARADIADYIDWYNAARAHSAWAISRPTSTTSPTASLGQAA
jgi:putative transposase